MDYDETLKIPKEKLRKENQLPHGQENTKKILKNQEKEKDIQEQQERGGGGGGKEGQAKDKSVKMATLKYGEEN